MVRNFGLTFESTGFRSQLREDTVETLMSSDRTKQICLWMTIYIYMCVSVWITFTVSSAKGKKQLFY